MIYSTIIAPLPKLPPSFIVYIFFSPLVGAYVETWNTQGVALWAMPRANKSWASISVKHQQIGGGSQWKYGVL
jgi:hypothetical protein